MSAEALLKARIIADTFCPTDDPLEDNPEGQHHILITRKGRSICIRVAESKDGGDITGIPHKGQVAMTLIAPNSTRSICIDGEPAMEWLEKLKMMVDSMFKDPVCFEDPGDNI